MDEFKQFASKLLFPTSNHDLKEATKWFEETRKRSNSFEFYMSILRGPITEGESIVATQSLLWISKRGNMDDRNLQQLLFYLYESGGTFCRPAVFNFYEAIASCHVRVHSTEIVQCFCANFVESIGLGITISILKSIPQLVISTELFRGSRESILSATTISSFSLLSELPLMFSLLDSMIESLITSCKLANVTEFSQSIASPSFTSSHLLESLRDILECTVEWLSLPSKLLSEHSLNVSLPCREIIVHSKAIELVCSLLRVMCGGGSQALPALLLPLCLAPIYSQCGEVILCPPSMFLCFRLCSFACVLLFC